MSKSTNYGRNYKVVVTKAGKQLFKLDTQVTVHISSDITFKKLKCVLKVRW